MPCTTILAGKQITYNGSTMISRNDDNANGTFTAKRLALITPEEQPRLYQSVISHLTIELPDNPLIYTAVPNADIAEEGIWAVGGINYANTAMTATETITTNERVLAADPPVVYDPKTGTPGGIGEEDIVVLVLPYIHSAREGVQRLGSLLETYGTYENNGIAFSDHDEVWYMETVGGHHWIARRLPDDCYAVIANQFSLDTFDLEDAIGAQKNYMASADIIDFIQNNHLDLSLDGKFNARLAFGSHTDSDHVYNTPRVWDGQRYFNPNSENWNEISPESDDLPWCRRPESRVTVEDIKTVLSSVYNGTIYDPYGKGELAGLYRPIGINRTSYVGLYEIRNDVAEELAGVQWFSFASNVYNVFVPQYTHILQTPYYFAHTKADQVSTDSYYWNCRLISALADPIINPFCSLWNAIACRPEARPVTSWKNWKNTNPTLR